MLPPTKGLVAAHMQCRVASTRRSAMTASFQQTQKTPRHVRFRACALAASRPATTPSTALAEHITGSCQCGSSYDRANGFATDAPERVSGRTPRRTLAACSALPLHAPVHLPAPARCLDHRTRASAGFHLAGFHRRQTLALEPPVDPQHALVVTEHLRHEHRGDDFFNSSRIRVVNALEARLLAMVFRQTGRRGGHVVKPHLPA